MKNSLFKRFIGFILLFEVIVSMGCVTTRQSAESADQFTKKLEVSIVAPTRFYRWIKADYASKAMIDIQSGLLEFSYDENGDYLVQSKKKGKKTLTIWGNQLLGQDKYMRTEVFTAFILAAYALQQDKEPLDTAFEALKQIVDEKIYHERKVQLMEVIQAGIQEYEYGGAAWETYQKVHFEIKDTMIRIK
ncbi:MAG: hypothetical protein LBB80_04625 [Treponema sp.]|jgi:hypothetical protein|nr:hypothetical protein [Treponema sp.]